MLVKCITLIVSAPLWSKPSKMSVFNNRWPSYKPCYDIHRREAWVCLCFWTHRHTHTHTLSKPVCFPGSMLRRMRCLLFPSLPPDQYAKGTAVSSPVLTLVCFNLKPQTQKGWKATQLQLRCCPKRLDKCEGVEWIDGVNTVLRCKNNGSIKTKSRE